VNPGIEVPFVAAGALAAGAGNGLETSASRFLYAEHFQPEGVLLGFVPDQVGAFYLALLPIVLGEIDQARTLRAEHVHAQA
jgi:hypothetical protein